MNDYTYLNFLIQKERSGIKGAQEQINSHLQTIVENLQQEINHLKSAQSQKKS